MCCVCVVCVWDQLVTHLLNRALPEDGPYTAGIRKVSCHGYVLLP